MQSFDDLNGSIQIFIDGVTSTLCEDGCLKVPRDKWVEAAKQFGPFTRPSDLDHTDSLPTDAQIDCLEALLSDCEGIVKKAVMPTVWLALAVCASDTRMHDSGLHIHIGLANLPIGAGLGSSAAFCVASVASLLQLTGRIENSSGHTVSDSDRELINHWAFAAETLFHGQPSGLDNTVSWYVKPVQTTYSPIRCLHQFMLMHSHLDSPSTVFVLLPQLRRCAVLPQTTGHPPVPPDRLRYRHPRHAHRRLHQQYHQQGGSLGVEYG